MEGAKVGAPEAWILTVTLSLKDVWSGVTKTCEASVFQSVRKVEQYSPDIMIVRSKWDGCLSASVSPSVTC